ncbi:MAG: DUF1365 domain-containing protein [Pseudomonadota bacterium]
MMQAAAPSGAPAARFDRFEPRIYAGSVMHLRLRPKRHLFRYRVFCLWLDIDRIEETLAPLRRLRWNRFGLMSVHAADHGARDGSAWRPWVDARLAEAGRPRPARVMLLSFPRMLGYAFNPLSIYYCYDAAGRLSDLVYEVKNTFGDQHPYVLQAGPERGGLHRQDQLKEFFVSPFIDMEKTYRFAIAPPGARLAVRIEETDAQGPYLIATWNGAAERLTDAALLRRFLAQPAMTRGVLAAIHWEALRLFLKGVRFLGHPGDDKVVVTRGPSRPA